MKYDRYDQETAYRSGEIAETLLYMNSTLIDVSSKLSELLDIERAMLETQRETCELQRVMHDMQTEMFEDYRKVKDRAHVKLQGDTEVNHAATHTT